jgi:opacity protein-like surface antigen
MRWNTSSLFRVGLLLDPQDRIYAIAGWTYGGFEAIVSSDQVFGPVLKGTYTFGLHGGTIGAGLERRFTSKWSAKAEYRYTKFQSKIVVFPASYVSTSGSSVTTGTTTNSSRFSAEIHSIQVGVSRHFDPY